MKLSLGQQVLLQKFLRDGEVVGSPCGTEEGYCESCMDLWSEYCCEIPITHSVEDYFEVTTKDLEAASQGEEIDADIFYLIDEGLCQYQKGNL